MGQRMLLMGVLKVEACRWNPPPFQILFGLMYEMIDTRPQLCLMVSWCCRPHMGEEKITWLCGFSDKLLLPDGYLVHVLAQLQGENPETGQMRLKRSSVVDSS